MSAPVNYLLVIDFFSLFLSFALLILPLTVLGKDSTNSTFRGCL